MDSGRGAWKSGTRDTGAYDRRVDVCERKGSTAGQSYVIFSPFIGAGLVKDHNPRFSAQRVRPAWSTSHRMGRSQVQYNRVRS